MNTSKLRKFAWVLFALTLASSTVFGQGWRNENSNGQNQNGNCLHFISNLTEKQQKQIVELEENHQKSMAELRTNRRSTTNAIEKNKIRGEMLKKVEAHRNSIQSLLNEDQQEQYARLHSQGYAGQNRNFRNSRVGNRGQQQFARGNQRIGRFANGNGYGNGGAQFCAQNNFRGPGNGHVNFRGRGASIQYGNGRGFSRGNVAAFRNQGNNFHNRNASVGRGYGRFNLQDSCNTHGSRNISTEGFEIIK